MKRLFRPHRSDPKPFYSMIRDLFVSADGRRLVGVPEPTKAHWFLKLLHEKWVHSDVSVILYR